MYVGNNLRKLAERSGLPWPVDVEAQIREIKERWRGKFGDLFIVHKTKVY